VVAGEEDPADLDPAWIAGKARVGVTAGASAPDDLVQGLIEALRSFAKVEFSTLPGVKEDVRFKLPPQLA